MVNSLQDENNKKLPPLDTIYPFLLLFDQHCEWREGNGPEIARQPASCW